MAGKFSDSETYLKLGNKFNSNMVKISSSKSILSYQNGSALDVENRECTREEGMPEGGGFEETSMSEETLTEDQNLKSECLDILRKKLISDLSLTVFSTDLENKLTQIEPIEISKERQTVIQKLVVQISQLSDAEKLLLYLKLPSSTSSPFDPLRQPLNPLGNRQEIQQTIVWIKTHLEEDSEISIPKQDVYDQYLKYCENVSMKPLSTADFGKVMKQVYPGVRPRRLGTRGNSRYCYSGMRNTCKLPTPILPQSSIESLVTNGSATDASSRSIDSNKYKKVEKTKRKCKPSACRSDKCTTSNQASYFVQDGDSTERAKTAKRTKVDDINCGEGTDSKSQENGKDKMQGNVERIKEETDSRKIKSEENSDNSYNAFDVEYNGLSSDFGIFLKDVERMGRNSSSRSGVASSSPAVVECDEKQKNISKDIGIDGSNSEANAFSLINGDQMAKLNMYNNHIRNKTNDVGHSVLEQPKLTKAKTRKFTSCSKSTKNFKKSYVPIQPKPMEPPQLNVLFEQPIGISQLTPDGKKDPDRLALCEESDSQEPEEEIVRYFKNMDEKVSNADGLFDQAVNKIENNLVQINEMPQIVNKNVGSFRGSVDVMSQATQQVLRSQSCFEVQRGLFNLNDCSESVYVPRSQSSVELPTSTDQTQQEATESKLSGKKKKISHLRILLEKSITSASKNTYPGFKDSLASAATSSSPVMSSNAQITCSVNQAVSCGSNFIFSKAKPAERDLLKLNGLKVVSMSSTFVPQSPNTRTKFFSFTPISPGPQSPLKTPSTPSASPFVSPRDTPIPRCKQNSSNDFFLSPSDKKSSLRLDGAKGEMVNETVFNFSKSLNSQTEESKPLGYFQTSRPRSSSSTNFCRSKSTRSSKLVGYHKALATTPKSRIQVMSLTNVSGNTPFSIHKNFASSDSLSNEVRRFLENNSKLTEGQSATIRSQSVPLNRMISESSWVLNQISPGYTGYVDSGNSNPALGPVSGKIADWVTNSDTNSPKNVTVSLPQFGSSEEMVNLGSSTLSNDVFSGDPAMVHLNDQYFSGDFPSGAEENFSESDSFREESDFSNKLDLNSSGTFDSAFTSDSDPAIADNIKSYLPDFEGLDNKVLMEPPGNCESMVTENRKLFKSALYESGSDNLKDPVITSFKPVLTNEMSKFPDSPVLNFFGTKVNEDNQQLIEFFNFED